MFTRRFDCWCRGEIESVLADGTVMVTYSASGQRWQKQVHPKDRSVVRGRARTPRECEGEVARLQQKVVALTQEKAQLKAALQQAEAARAAAVATTAAAAADADADEEGRRERSSSQLTRESSPFCGSGHSGSDPRGFGGGPLAEAAEPEVEGDGPAGPDSRRRHCHSAAPPSLPLAGASIGMGKECHQNDSLTDG